MTVCVAVKVHDCIVFAADSATSLIETDANGNQQIVNIFENANKVFNIRKGLPICAMTAGIGNFGSSSISTLSKDLRTLLGGDKPEWRVDPVHTPSKRLLRKLGGFSTRRVFYQLSQDRRVLSTTGLAATLPTPDWAKFGG